MFWNKDSRHTPVNAEQNSRAKVVLSIFIPVFLSKSILLSRLNFKAYDRMNRNIWSCAISDFEIEKQEINLTYFILHNIFQKIKFFLENIALNIEGFSQTCVTSAGRDIFPDKNQGKVEVHEHKI